MAAIGEARPEPGLGADPIEQLLRELRPTLASIFWRFHIPTAEAEDLLQNSLLSLVSHRALIVNERAWLLGAVRRQCLMYWRQQRRRLYDALDGTVLEALAAPTMPDQERRQLRCDLSTTIAKLPARCRSIFRLRYGLGWEPDEVACRLGYRQSSMHKVTSRCLSALALSFGGVVPARPRP